MSEADLGSPVSGVATGSGAQRKQWAASLAAVVLRGILLIAMLSVAAIELLPILWMISTSLRPPATSFELPPDFLPTQWRWRNYWEVITSDQINYPLFFFNSLKISVSVTALQLFTCSLAAYAFARLRFRARDMLFSLYLASLMVPGVVTIIPNFVIMRSLGLFNTHWALILPGMTNSFGVFLLRQYFLTLPADLYDAAKIDGAGFFRIYWQVMLPLVGPGLSALGILTFLGSWNNYIGPLLFLRTWDKMTLPIALVTLQGYMGTGSLAHVLAGIMLSILPVLVLFLLGQRFVIQGIALTGIRG